MKLTADQLLTQANRGFAPVTWISGNEPLLVLELADKLRLLARQQGYSEREVLHVDRFTRPSDISESAGSMSLFADKRLVELRLPTGKLKADLGERLASVASELSDDTRFLVISEALDRTVAPSTWYKKLDSHMNSVVIWPLRRNEVPQWIAGRLQTQKQKADRGLLEWLADRVEGNLLAADQEVRKLALLCEQGQLDEAAVRQVVMNVARYDPFQVADQAINGDLARASRGLMGLQAEGEAVQKVTWAFAEAIRNLLKLSEAVESGQSLGQACAALRLFAPRETLYSQAVRRLQRDKIALGLDLVAAADRLGKGISDRPTNRVAFTDPWTALIQASAVLAGKPL